MHVLYLLPPLVSTFIKIRNTELIKTERHVRQFRSCFLAVLIVVYIRYEITQSLASFYFVFPSPHLTQLNGPCTILLRMVQLVCAHITGVFVVHVSSRWYCSRPFEAHWRFIFYEIILVSVLDSDNLHSGLVFWWSTCDCQPVNGVVISEFY
jgi:hypothetical protein